VTLRQPDDCLFNDLAELARVPAAGIETLRRGVFYELSLRSMGRSPVLVGSNKRAITQLRRVAKLFRELDAIVSNLDQQALKAILYVDHRRKEEHLRKEDRRRGEYRHGQPPRPPRPPPEQWSKSRWPNFPEEIKELAELSSEALTFLRAGPPPKPRGRPRRGAFSTIFSDSLAEFTLYLLLDVRAAGGRLTLDKNAGTGTLVKALELLRPYVPPRSIPNRLPLSTLARVKALDKKIATGPDPIENIQS
jgi:hypothetical protein